VDRVSFRVMIQGDGFEIRVCRSSACPMAAMDPEPLLPSLKKVLEEAALGDFFASLTSSARKRFRFRVAVAACPNACTQVQIADFGLVGQMVPTLSGDCVSCGVCEEVCEEGAVTVSDRWPLFDAERCINCGLCIRACPKQVLTAEARGFRVLVGGKLGRHPQLAKEIRSLADETTVLKILERVLLFYKKFCLKGERLGTVIQREGWEKFCQFLHQFD